MSAARPTESRPRRSAGRRQRPSGAWRSPRRGLQRQPPPHRRRRRRSLLTGGGTAPYQPHRRCQSIALISRCAVRKQARLTRRSPRSAGGAADPVRDGPSRGHILDDPNHGRSALRSSLERWRDRPRIRGCFPLTASVLVRSGLTPASGVADHVRAGMEVMSKAGRPLLSRRRAHPAGAHPNADARRTGADLADRTAMQGSAPRLPVPSPAQVRTTPGRGYPHPRRKGTNQPCRRPTRRPASSTA